jgi:hypothetical protein
MLPKSVATIATPRQSIAALPRDNQLLEEVDTAAAALAGKSDAGE